MTGYSGHGNRRPPDPPIISGASQRGSGSRPSTAGSITSQSSYYSVGMHSRDNSTSRDASSSIPTFDRASGTSTKPSFFKTRISALFSRFDRSRGKTPKFDHQDHGTLPNLSPIEQAIQSRLRTVHDADGVVTSGTLEGLVEFLINGFNLPGYTYYCDTFLTACSELTTPEDLFQLLSRRLSEEQHTLDGGATKQYTFIFIIYWLKSNCFSPNEELLYRIKFFCNSIQLYPSLDSVAKEASQLIDFKVAPTTVRASNPQEPALKSYEIKPRDLAVALSLLEGDHYRALQPSDYLLYLSKDQSDRVRAYHRTNEKIRLWVIRSILHYGIVSDRSSVMKFFINTAVECHSMRNFSSTVTISSALHSVSVEGLKATKKALSTKMQAKLSTLHALIDPISNHRGYYDAIQAVATDQERDTCIPWLAVHLKELEKVALQPLTVLVEGQHLVNFNRYNRFMDRNKETLYYSPPDLEDKRHGGQLAYLLKQLGHIDLSGELEQQLLAKNNNSSNLDHVRDLEEENPQGGLESGEDAHTSPSISRHDAVKSSSACLSAPVDVMNHLAETIGDIEALLHDIGINPNDVAFAAGFDEKAAELGEILAPYSGLVSTPLRRYYPPTHLPSSGKCTFSEFISFHAKPMGVSLELLAIEKLEGIQNESDTTARSPSSTGSGNRSEGVQKGDQNRDKDSSGSQREAARGSRPPDDSASGGNDGDAEGSHSLPSFPPDHNPPKLSRPNAVHFEVAFNIRHSEGKCMPHQTIRLEGTVQSEEIPEASLPHAMPHATLSSRIRFRRIDFFGNAGRTGVNQCYRQSSAYVKIDVGKDQGQFQVFDVEPQSMMRQDSKVKQVETYERTRQHQVDMSTNFTILPLPKITFGGKYGHTAAQTSSTSEESSVNINKITHNRTRWDTSWHYSVDDKWVKGDGLRGLAPSASLSFSGTKQGRQKPDKLKIEVESTWTIPDAGLWDIYSCFVRNIPIRTLATQVTFDIPPQMTTSWTVFRDMDVRIITKDKGFRLELQIESDEVSGNDVEAQDFHSSCYQPGDGG